MRLDFAGGMVFTREARRRLRAGGIEDGELDRSAAAVDGQHDHTVLSGSALFGVTDISLAPGHKHATLSDGSKRIRALPECFVLRGPATRPDLSELKDFRDVR